MIDDIRTARERVWVEIYIFIDDRLGRQIAEALKERARAGVEVRVLYDAIGSQGASSQFFREMAESGVQVHAFHTFWEALWRMSIFQVLNRRDHRKLLVIDDRVCYFGGMNLFDQSSAAGIEQAGSFPGSAGWRDVHVRLVGPKQAEVAESFERAWRRAHGQRVKRRPLYYGKALLDPGDESIQFFDSGPGMTHTRAARVFRQLFNLARRSILMSMAYFLPIGLVLRDLLRAHRRGVGIRVVVPGQSDVPLVQCATRYLYGQLLRRRLHIYERQENMLHSKVMVVDDQWTLLGSSNLDPRSLWINLEFLAVVHSRALARAMKHIILFEIERSRRIRLAESVKRSWWCKLLDRVAWSFGWLL
jgi:cardiolipin synthase